MPWVLHWPPSWSEKNSLRFRPTKRTRKIGEQRTGKVLHAILLAHLFADNFGCVKVSAKENSLRPSHEPARDLSRESANKKKKAVTPYRVFN